MELRAHRGALLILLISVLPALVLQFTHLDLPQFGAYQDDGLLFINAKALSQGHGFRLTSLPGEPAQTKYQPLLPWLQTVIWKLNPRFPANLPAVALLQMVFFLAFIVLAAAYLGWAGFSPALAAVVATSPLVVYWAAIPMADTLFAALVMGVFLATGRQAWLLAGVLAAAAYLTKSTGLLLVPAVGFALLLKRQWRPLATFLLATVPAIAGWLLWSKLHRSPPAHLVLAYYTDYTGYLLRGGGLQALGDIVPANAVTLCTAAGSLFWHDIADSLIGRFLSILVAAATVTGGVRLARRTGAPEYPFFCALLAAVLCVWNFSPSVRLILPLAPLVVVGVWLEGENFVRLVRQSLATGGANRVVAYGLTAAAVLFAAYALWQNAVFLTQTIPGVMTQSRQKFQDLAAVHAWMRRHLPQNAAVLAADDTLLYLNTGLHAVRPVPNSVAFYRNDSRQMLENFTAVEELERAFGLTHVLVGPTDLAADFGPSEQREALRLLRENPHHRPIYEQDGYTVYRIDR